MFDGNWCKFLFFSLSSFQLVVYLIKYTHKGIIPNVLLQTINYGKLRSNKESSKIIKNLPKSYCRHFYILAAFIYTPIALYQVSSAYFLKREVSTWFMTLLNACCGSNQNAVVSATHTFMAVLLLSLQVLRRFCDTQFVSVFSKNAKITIIHYALGLIFYLGAFLTILCEAPKFANTGLPTREDIELTDVGIFDVIAVAVFLWSWYHQYTTTVILANLRKNKNGDVVNEGLYRIPEGDLFKYLSSPHVTTEILMYTCIWVIMGINHSWCWVYLLVLSNQFNSIISSHKWYQKQFKHFPKERKSLIPCII